MSDSRIKVSHELTSEETAKKLAKVKGTGRYIVRPSVRFEGYLVLSIALPDAVENILFRVFDKGIQTKGGKIYGDISGGFIHSCHIHSLKGYILECILLLKTDELKKMGFSNLDGGTPYQEAESKEEKRISKSPPSTVTTVSSSAASSSTAIMSAISSTDVTPVIPTEEKKSAPPLPTVLASYSNVSSESAPASSSTSAVTGETPLVTPPKRKLPDKRLVTASTGTETEYSKGARAAF